LYERDQVLFSHPDTPSYFLNVLLDNNARRHEARPLAQDKIVPIQTVELDLGVVPEDLLQSFGLACPFIDFELLGESFLQ
jgi:hypothetical protein